MSNDDVNSSPQSSVNEPVGESKPKLTLDFLVKLIPNNFDGDRYKVTSFIKQVDSVFELAWDDQHVPLLLYVKSRITGKAREQVDVHCNLVTWKAISN